MLFFPSNSCAEWLWIVDETYSDWATLRRHNSASSCRNDFKSCARWDRGFSEAFDPCFLKTCISDFCDQQIPKKIYEYWRVTAGYIWIRSHNFWFFAEEMIELWLNWGDIIANSLFWSIVWPSFKICIRFFPPVKTFSTLESFIQKDIMEPDTKY
jgi:hypothetical protein